MDSTTQTVLIVVILGGLLSYMTWSHEETVISREIESDRISKYELKEKEDLEFDKRVREHIGT